MLKIAKINKNNDLCKSAFPKLGIEKIKIANQINITS
jgi:hypothetical protein